MLISLQDKLISRIQTLDLNTCLVLVISALILRPAKPPPFYNSNSDTFLLSNNTLSLNKHHLDILFEVL